MKIKRSIIQIDDELCDGCGNCVPSCAEGAIEIIDGKAKVIADKYCDGLGACLGECPQGALSIIEREADDFDEEAVEELLKEKEIKDKSKKAPETLACGCPSAAMKTFPMNNMHPGKQASPASGGPSALGHWPVQINLVPAGAPFLRDADLLIAADCVPVAYPSFHADFLKGKAVMIGCPKFDDAQGYVEKLSQVFKESGIKSITSVVMEVPCCSGLPMIIGKALEKSGMDIPFEEVVVSAQGEILS
ncbi:MAG: 4Fe-4S ferredoxin [Desulfobacteraceae bacterium]|nr:4Fe-4S ferredoxin [Desulfobacteraceae bacterium]